MAAGIFEPANRSGHEKSNCLLLGGRRSFVYERSCTFFIERVHDHLPAMVLCCVPCSLPDCDFQLTEGFEHRSLVVPCIEDIDTRLSNAVV